MLEHVDISACRKNLFVSRQDNDVDVSIAISIDDNELLRERGRIFRETLRLWAETPETGDEATPIFEWSVFDKYKNNPKRKKDFSRALAFLYILDLREDDDTREWIPYVARAFAGMLFEQAAETTSPPSISASFTVISVLPEAVAPTIANILFVISFSFF